MTTAIAFKTKHGSIMMGVDLKITSYRNHPEDITSKFYDVDEDITILTAGTTLLHNYLEDYLPITKFDKESDFKREFRDKVINNFFNYQQACGVKEANYAMIIRFKNKLYCVQDDKAILECEYSAIGSGADYALGAIALCFKDASLVSSNTRKAVATSVLGVAALFDYTTGDKFYVKEYCSGECYNEY